MKKETKQARKCIYLFITILLLRNVHKLYSTEKECWNNVMLVTAHPDDESMFFSPLIYHTKPFILCLSNGNFNKLGKKREQEMNKLCESNGLKYKILDYEDNSDWNTQLIAIDVLKYAMKYNIKYLVTFGPNGVSGHKNHISCHKAVRLIEKIAPNDLLLFKYLKDWPIFQKYFLNFERSNFTLSPQNFYGFKNMLIFKTQMVWFRYIYCILSNYMQSNAF